MLNRIAINLLSVFISLATGCDKIKSDKVADNVRRGVCNLVTEDLAPNFLLRDEKQNKALRQSYLFRFKRRISLNLYQLIEKIKNAKSIS